MKLVGVGSSGKALIPQPTAVVKDRRSGRYVDIGEFCRLTEATIGDSSYVAHNVPAK